MAKPEWGQKRICQNCGARFYDLNRSPIVCPKCETEFDPEAWMRSRRVRASEKPKAQRAAAAPTPAETESDEAVESDDDDTLIEGDDDDLDDGDDIGGIAEKGEDENER